MAHLTLVNKKVWIGGRDYSGDLNAIGVEAHRQMKDNTTLDRTAAVNMPGLREAIFSHAGFWDDPADSDLYAKHGLAGVPLTVGAAAGAAGEQCFLLETIEAEYNPISGAAGEALQFAISGKADDLVNGTILHNATRTTSGAGTAYQVGAAASGYIVFAALHVLTAAGTAPTLDVVIGSDDAVGFPSGVSRITFTQQTAVGYEWKSLAGPVTDDWWRAEWTIGGSSPSFEFILSMGIIKNS